jgi:hypothetical protein
MPAHMLWRHILTIPIHQVILPRNRKRAGNEVEFKDYVNFKQTIAYCGKKRERALL